MKAFFPTIIVLITLVSYFPPPFAESLQVWEFFLFGLSRLSSGYSFYFRALSISRDAPFYTYHRPRQVDRESLFSINAFAAAASLIGGDTCPT